MRHLRLAVFLASLILNWANAEIVFPSPIEQEDDTDYWLEHGRMELREALEKPRITNRAKNVILFLGDGMGITVSTAGRILKGQKKGHSGEEGYLVWERFPNMGLMKTYNLDRQVSDSAATATAFLAGVKANYYTLGVNGKVKINDCKASLKEENRVETVLRWAQDADKETGVVTTAQISHATPAALYAKSASRKWQCDTKIKAMGEAALGCKDIASQLIEDEPGMNMKVIIGGGRQEMGAPEWEWHENKCLRSDGRNLVEEWKKDKAAQGKTHAYASTTRQLREIDVDDTEYIMGLFGDGHVPYEVDRNTTLDGTPHIKEMVEVALKRLQKSENGYFLMVEGGRIDHGLHDSKPKRSLEELLAFEEAVEATLDSVDPEETLVIVTADHSHVMTINGYPERGNNILGLVESSNDVSDGLPFSTLMFTNGQGFNFTWNGEEVTRWNLTGTDTMDKDFVPLAAVPTYEGSETHGGEDVAAFALGPFSHLFHRVHEQTHVAHVMGYAACIGPYSDCDRPAKVPANVYNTVKDRVKKDDGKGQSPPSVTISSALIVMTVIVQMARYF